MPRHSTISRSANADQLEAEVRDATRRDSVPHSVANVRPRRSLLWRTINARARAFHEKRGWYDEGQFDDEGSTAEGRITVPCCRYVKAV